MSEIQYYDADGNPVSLDRLCLLEPVWAANRIRVLLGEVERLRAELDALRANLAASQGRRRGE